MDIIYCLVGPSGSGKTTLAKALEEDYNIILSYTTRPPRSEHEWGHTFVEKDSVTFTDDHTFVTINEGEVTSGHDVVAHKEIYGHDYWATKDQYHGKGKSVYVIDPAGVDILKKNVQDAELVVIYLACDTSVCENRMFDRAGELKDGDPIAEKLEKAINTTRKIKERVNHDKEVFRICKADWVVNANGEFDEVLTLVRAAMESG